MDAKKLNEIKTPSGWTDQSDRFFEPGEGIAFSKASKSKKFGKGITAKVRTRYMGDDAILDDRLANFGINDFCLVLGSPRGFGREAIALRQIKDQYGSIKFSSDLQTLLVHAERAITEAEDLE
jgi:hypothetical protein